MRFFCAVLSGTESKDVMMFTPLFFLYPSTAPTPGQFTSLRSKTGAYAYTRLDRQTRRRQTSS